MSTLPQHIPIPEYIQELIYNATPVGSPERQAVIGNRHAWGNATPSTRRMACLYVSVALQPLGWRAVCADAWDPASGMHVASLLLVTPEGTKVDWRTEREVTNLAMVYEP